MKDYPDTNAVLVRRHGVYVWGGMYYNGEFCKKSTRTHTMLFH